MTNFSKTLITTTTCLLFIWFQQATANTDAVEVEIVSDITENTESNQVIDSLLVQIQALSKEDLRALRKAIKSSMGLKNKKDKKRKKNCKNKSKHHDGYKNKSEKKHVKGSSCMWKDNSNYKPKKKCKSKKYAKHMSRSTYMGHGQRIHHVGFKENFYGMRGINHYQYHYGGHWPNANPWGWGRYY